MSTEQVTQAKLTQTELRLTRAPADTPRGRLHRAAALGIRAAREARHVISPDSRELTSLRSIARRCVVRLRGDRTVGAAFVSNVCYALDRALAALDLLSDPGFGMLCQQLVETLVLLESGEVRQRELEAELAGVRRDLAIERGHNEQLRASLAAEQVRAAAALQNTPKETWEEPTRNRTLTSDEIRMVRDPDADIGVLSDVLRSVREESTSLRDQRDAHARTISLLRGEVRALYGSYRVMIERLGKHENVESTQVRRERHHDALNNLGVYDIGPR